MKYLEDKKLLELRFSNGMLILPYIRYRLMCIVNQDNSSNSTKEPISKITILKRLLTNIPKLKIKKRKIVYFSTTLFNIESEDKSGHYYNSMDGYYYDLFPNDSLIIEDADENMIWRTNNSYDVLSFINTYLLFFSMQVSHICNIIKPIYRSDFDYLVKNYPETFLLSELGRMDYFHRIYSYLIKKLLKKIGCKLIAVNCGSYGGTYAPLIKTAHNLGINVVEMQHGAISASHLAYHADNFITQDKEFASYIPDCLYTFGDYWKQYINWRYEIIPVGNPHLNKYAIYYAKEAVVVDYLVISQPSIRESILLFVRDLANSFTEKSIVLRLHPRDDVDFYQKGIASFSNISLSFSFINLYKDISRCHYIVGGYSTCLFEALAFYKSPIIIDIPLVRKYFPDNIGIWVKNVSELKQQQERKTLVDAHYFWTDDFENKVKILLQNYVK